jgi:rubrerythrin
MEINRWGTVDKLTSSNYITWKIRMRAMLTSMGLKEAVEGTLPSVTAEDKKEKEEKESKALTFILMHVSDMLLGLIQDSTSPKEAWNILANMYGQQSDSAATKLKIELARLEQEHGEKINDYFERTMALWQKLILHGGTMTSSEVTLFFLNGLHENYSHMVSSFEAQATVPSLDFIMIKLRSYEQRVIRRIEEASPKALATRFKKQFKGKCWNCGESGHPAVDCKQPKKDKGHTTVLSTIAL